MQIVPTDFGIPRAMSASADVNARHSSDNEADKRAALFESQK
jgi:hypothetical protein